MNACSILGYPGDRTTSWVSEGKYVKILILSTGQWEEYYAKPVVLKVERWTYTKKLTLSSSVHQLPVVFTAWVFP